MTDRERSLLEKLEPSTRAAYMLYRAGLAASGIQARAIVTHRSRADQEAKHAAGRSANKVGWHELDRAVDEQLLNPATGAWDDQALAVPMWRARARIAEQHGFRQLGFNQDGTKRYIKGPKGPIWDPYHIEYRHPFATLAEALRAADNTDLAVDFGDEATDPLRRA